MMSPSSTPVLGGTMRTRTTAAIAALLITGLAGCSSKPEPNAKAASPSVDESAVAKASGIPPEPTGAKRQQLLDTIGKAAPDTIRYEDKAIDAARNQCSALDSDKADWLASQRFTYKDVTTTEAQGKAIDAALKGLGFCNV